MKSGHELAGLTAGLDQLYRSTKSSDGFLDREGLIPVAMAPVEPILLRDYNEATERLQNLINRLPQEAESELRQAYLSEMADSLLMLIETFQEKPVSFQERLKRQLRVDTQKIGAEIFDGYYSTIREKLDELGYRSGDLTEDVKRFEDDNRVAPEAVLATLAELTKEARRRSNAMMYDLGDDWIEPVAAQDVPFSAYCDYPGRRLILNLDLPYTTYSLKHLATHEAFPGHLVHMGLRERYVKQGLMPLDGAQVVTSSASSALFEGIADNGLFFLDWVDTPADELAVALQRLRSASRCNAAWMLHVENKSLEDIAEITAKAAFQKVSTVRSRLSFLKHGLRAPFVYAYWCGEVAVHDVWKTVEKDRRKEFWDHLYGHMHTPSTLRDFWK